MSTPFTLRFIPSTRLLALLALLACTLLLMLVANFPPALTARTGLVALAIVTLVCLVDGLRTLRRYRQAPLTMDRQLPTAFALGVTRHVHLQITNTGVTTWRGHVLDDHDSTLQSSEQPLPLHCQPSSRVTLSYAIVPRQRGSVTFRAAHVRLRSCWQLLDAQTQIGASHTLRVYPDFAQVARFAWLATDRRLAEIGIKTFRQRGEGTDFKQLTEYQQGDNIRHLDWKATARTSKLIVRQYQNERDQAVVFLLDAGRRLRADDTQSGIGLAHFDQVLNAVMLLTYVALQQGDAVGALTFGTPPDQERWFAPRKGQQTLNALMNSLHAVQPSITHSDYVAAARHLLKRLPKRSLVIVLTNFRSEDAGELQTAIDLLQTKHRVITASLREQVLRAMTEQPINDQQAILDMAGAHHYQQQRQHAFNRLAARNTLLVDAEPQRLGVELVNRYEAVKRAGLL